MLTNKLNLYLYTKNGTKLRFACIYVPGKTIKHIAAQSHLMQFRKIIPCFHYAEYSIYEKDLDSPCEAGVIDSLGNPYYGNIQPEIELIENE